MITTKTLQNKIWGILTRIARVEGIVGYTLGSEDPATLVTRLADLATAEGQIATLQADLDLAEGAISTLQTDLALAEGVIDTLLTDLSALAARVTALENP